MRLSKEELRQIAEMVIEMQAGGSTKKSAGASRSEGASSDTGGRKYGLTPDEAIVDYPSLTVRTIKRAITEGRLRGSNGGKVSRAELDRFVKSRS